MTSPGNIGGYLTLGARMAAALGTIAVDRVEELFGRALPRTGSQLARPAVVDELIRRGTPPGQEVLAVAEQWRHR